MGEDSIAALASRWNNWVSASLGGTPDQVTLATHAAMAVAAAGGTQEEAAEAARAAWRGEVSRLPSAARRTTGDLALDSRRSVTARPDEVRGRVAGLQQRNELQGRRYLSVWNFRVEREDKDGRALPPVSVEMRGFSFEGALANGDEVEIGDKPKSRQVLHVHKVENLTSNAVISVRKGPPPRATRAVGGGLKAIFLVVALAIIAIAIWIQTADVLK